MDLALDLESDDYDYQESHVQVSYLSHSSAVCPQGVHITSLSLIYEVRVTTGIN